MDFRKAVIESLDKLVASGSIEECIQKTLAETIARVVKHELDPYSNFGKQLTEAVKQSLALESALNLPSYNQTILKIVEAQMQQHTNAVIQQQVAGRLKELLEPAPESITLSALVEKYIEHVKDHREAGCHCHGDGKGITLNVRESDHGFVYVSLDDEPNRREHECDIQMGVHKGAVYHLRFSKADVEKEMFAGPFYGFERLLFQMKAAGTKLVFDCPAEDIETSYEMSSAD